MYQQITPYLTIETSRPLGRGDFSYAYNGMYKNIPVAVKELKRFHENKQENVYFLPEAQLSERLKNVPCENLVSIIDVYPSSHELQQNPIQNQIAYIVMELCCGNLRGYLKEQKTIIDMYQGIQIIRSIAEGVKVLHSIGIAHRDITPENIFLTKTKANYIFKLGDFGLGKNEDIAKVASSIFDTQIGAISYMAPEMLNLNPKNYTSKVDIWALGVMTHEILTGVNLFPGLNPAAVRQNILKMNSYMSKSNEAKNKIVLNSDTIAQSFRMITRDEVVQLIDAMLQPEPNKRSDIATICSQMEYVLQALMNPDQVQPVKKQYLDSVRQPQQYVVTQNKQQNKFIMMQGESQAEKEKQKEKNKKLEDQLLQTQEELQKIKWMNCQLEQKLQTFTFNSNNQIKQLEYERNSLEYERNSLSEKNKLQQNLIEHLESQNKGLLEMNMKLQQILIKENNDEKREKQEKNCSTF